MNVLDLFSGIGAFSLGLERAGMRTVAFCESNKFCRRVLAKHWPDVPIYDDVRTLTAERLRADGIAVDLVCGGWPCQDISVAGKGVGLDGERSGLWSEFARILGELRPRYAIMENVAVLTARGLDRVVGDLAEIFPHVEGHCIPASAVGAPHRRDRIWILAHADSGRCEGEWEPEYAGQQGASWCELDGRGAPGRRNGASDVPDAVSHDLRDEPWRRNGTRGSGAAGPQDDGAQEPVADAYCARSAQPEEGDARKRQLGGGTGAHSAAGSGHCSLDVADAGVAGLSAPERDPILTARRWHEGRAAAECGWWSAEPDVRGMVDGISKGLDGGLNACEGMDFKVNSQSASEGRLRGVWRNITSRSSSQGSGSDEQLARELTDALPDLPHALALAGGQSPMEAACRFLHRLRKACEAAGAVRDASEPTIAAWQSLPDEEAERAFLAAYGRADWSSGEWLGVGRVAHKVSARVDRLCSLGNSLVPQIPEIIGRAILEVEYGQSSQTSPKL